MNDISASFPHLNRLRRLGKLPARVAETIIEVVASGDQSSPIGSTVEKLAFAGQTRRIKELVNNPKSMAG